MGGMGSGNWYRWDTRTTTNECRRIDIRWMNREGMLKPGVAGSLSWSRGGEPTGNIRYIAYGEYLRLIYRHRRYDEEWKEADEKIYFDWTCCNYGGKRMWFLCPHCRRRTAILYGLDSGFLCRKCYRLPYACQSETQIDRLIRKRRKLGEKIEIDVGYGKPKGMHETTYRRCLDEYWRLDSVVDKYIFERFSVMR